MFSTSLTHPDSELLLGVTTETCVSRSLPTIVFQAPAFETRLVDSTLVCALATPAMVHFDMIVWVLSW